MSKILKAFSKKVVAYNPIYSEIGGSNNAGILLSQLIYWWFAVKERQFYKTNEELCQETHLSEAEMKSAKSMLIDKGLIRVELKSLPRKSYYVVIVSEIEAQISSQAESAVLDGRNSPDLMGENRRTTSESTTEITTDIRESVSKAKAEPKILTPLQESVNFFLERYQTLFGRPYLITNWGQIGKLFKPILDNFSALQVKALLETYLGYDKWIIEKGVPLEWFPKSVNEVRAYFEGQM